MPDRPNFLILFPDQQRHDTIAAAGFPHMKTPNLDRLAREGCLFDNAYSPNPVCVPARHYLMTGTTGRDHGYFHNISAPIADEGIPTLPQILSDHGYTTCAVGKMHFLPPRRHHGFDEMHLMEELPHFREEDAYAEYLAAQGRGDVQNLHGVRPYVYHTPQRALVPWEHHGENWVGRRAVEFLKQNGTRPFFLMCGWVKPHPPWDTPPDWEGRYAGRPLPEPWPRARDFPYESEPSAWYGDFDPPAKRRAVQEAYYTAISMIDHHVGRVLDHLDSTGLASNTLVVFTSDHGEMLYDRGFFQKQLPYESSVRVPFVARFPDRLPAGATDDRFVDLLDLAPTIWDAAGVALPAGPYPGESLLATAPRRDREHVVAESGVGAGRWVMVRNRRHKLIHWFNGGHEELYDTVADPGEQHNLLAAGPAPAGVVADLRTRLLAAEAERGPAGSVVDGVLQDHPAKVIGPPGMGKYPLWAHRQFPTWGPLPQDLEAALLEREIVRACDGEFDDLLDDARWEAAWREGWAALGGRAEFADRVFGEPPEPG